MRVPVTHPPAHSRRSEARPNAREGWLPALSGNYLLRQRVQLMHPANAKTRCLPSPYPWNVPTMHPFSAPGREKRGSHPASVMTTKVTVQARSLLGAGPPQPTREPTARCAQCFRKKILEKTTNPCWPT
jgi:hypothetical protein